MNRKRCKVTHKRAANPVATTQAELATMAEVCQLLRVCERTVVRRVAAGSLPGTKQGNQWRFPWAKIREIAGL